MAEMLQDRMNGMQNIFQFDRQAAEARSSIYAMAYRMLGNRPDAEDVTQETFVRAWAAYSSYDPERSFKGWALCIAHNLCMDYFRRRKHRSAYSLDMSGATDEIDRMQKPGRHPEETLDPALLVQRKETISMLGREIEKLPPVYSSSLKMAIEGHSYEEIATQLGCPAGTIRSRVHRARTLLRRNLDRRGISLTA